MYSTSLPVNIALLMMSIYLVLVSRRIHNLFVAIYGASASASIVLLLSRPFLHKVSFLGDLKEIVIFAVVTVLGGIAGRYLVDYSDMIGGLLASLAIGMWVREVALVGSGKDVAALDKMVGVPIFVVCLLILMFCKRARIMLRALGQGFAAIEMLLGSIKGTFTLATIHVVCMLIAYPALSLFSTAFNYSMMSKTKAGKKKSGIDIA